MELLERYIEALRSRDWDSLSTCLAPDVHRSGPYLDVVEGREEYVAFLSRVISGLPNYDIRLSRIDRLEAGAALVRLSEFVDIKGVRTEFPIVGWQSGKSCNRIQTLTFRGITCVMTYHAGGRI